MSYASEWAESRDFEFQHEGELYFASVMERFQRFMYGGDADGNRAVPCSERIGVDVDRVWNEDGVEVDDPNVLDKAREVA